MPQTQTIPLPSLAELPKVVVFHRTHPTSPRILMRVPTGPDRAESYVLRLDQVSQPPGTYNPALDHHGWLKRLPNSKDLLHKLTYEMNVAYYPHDGGCIYPLTDPDEVPWVRQIMIHARQENTNGPLGRMVEGNKRRRTAKTMAKPSLHTAISRSRPRGASSTW